MRQKKIEPLLPDLLLEGGGGGGGGDFDKNIVWSILVVFGNYFWLLYKGVWF